MAPPAGLSWYGAFGTSVALREKLLKLLNDFTSVQDNVESLKLKVKDDVDLISQISTAIQDCQSHSLGTFENDILKELVSYLEPLTNKCERKMNEIYAETARKTNLEAYWSRLAIRTVEETEKGLAMWVNRLHVRFSLLSERTKLETVRRLSRPDQALQFQYDMQTLSSQIRDLRANGQPIGHESLWLPESQVVAIDFESRLRRGFGTLNQRKVMVELITTNTAGSAEAATDAIGELAYILSRSDPSVFHVLRCMHVCPWQHAGSRSATYGMVFDIPEGLTSIRTLSEIVIESKQVQDQFDHSVAAQGQSADVSILKKLSSRYRLAHQLALSLRYLHSFGYIHQSIRSSNVLVALFVDRVEVYLGGFERSRPNAATSNQRRIDADWRNNIYRSPERVATTDEETIKRHTMSHDMYSLGVVLLELGVFEPLTTMESRFKDRPASVVRDVLQHLARQQLPVTMGDTYTKAVLHCLSSTPNSWIAAHLAHVDFVDEVIGPLQQLSGSAW